MSQTKVGVGVVIIKDGKTLLAKRRGSHASGVWSSCGGHLDFGETPIDAAKREAMEELGVEIGNVQFATCMSMAKYDKHYIDISFTAEILSGEPTICEPDKVECIEWFSLENLPENLFEPVAVVLEAMRTGENYFEKHD